MLLFAESVFGGSAFHAGGVRCEVAGLWEVLGCAALFSPATPVMSAASSSERFIFLLGAMVVVQNVNMSYFMVRIQFRRNDLI